MSTVFSIEQAFQVAGTDPVSAAKMRQWASVDPSALAGRPDLLQQCLYWKAQLERTVQSPQVQKAYTEAHRGLNVPSPQGMSIAAAARRGLYPQQQQVQAPQVHRGAVAYVQQKPDPALQQAVRNVQRTLDELPGRFAAAVQRSQVQAQRALVQRSQAAPAPQLPVSPITGQPSSLTGLVRRSVGLDGGYTPPPNLPNQKAVEYHQQRQVAQQVAAQKAQYEQSLPISPHTGQPSSLTQMVRASVGLK